MWVRWILQEAAQRAKTQPPFARTYAQIAHRRGKQIATVAIARRLLARCFHILTELEVTTEKVTTGRARISACACNTAVELTGAARPGRYRHADPARQGPEWVHARPTPTEVVRAFSPPDPAPVLAAVKVVRPVGRST